ncbi:cupin domain-containing protein [Paraburkholderia sp. BCC1884]|uniref:cupin domain-containing protein n=1 Tax=Paraburkholderia sp. BCC1884 TaxID=2562668 RepID=UPI00118247FE|nr:cupin domain-containing protein [Paraburkholderia sp. BCC1884]
MHFHKSKPVEYDFGGSRARMLVSGKHTAGSYCMIEIFSPAGRATPTHRHQHEDETIHMLEGALDVNIEGTVHTVRAGETLILQRGTAHQLINQGEQTARYLVICAPAGFDEFVESCSEVIDAPADLAPPSDAAKERMRAAAPRFGITLMPPQSAPVKAA